MSLAHDYSLDEPSRSEVDGLPGPVVLEFGNSWCGFCRRAEPLARRALENSPHIRHFRIADASGKPLGRSFRVKLWPTFIFLKDGAEISRLVRPADLAEFRNAVAGIGA